MECITVVFWVITLIKDEKKIGSVCKYKQADTNERTLHPFGIQGSV